MTIIDFQSAFLTKPLRTYYGRVHQYLYGSCTSRYRHVLLIRTPRRTPPSAAPGNSTICIPASTNERLRESHTHAYFIAETSVHFLETSANIIHACQMCIQRVEFLEFKHHFLSFTSTENMNKLCTLVHGEDRCGQS